MGELIGLLLGGGILYLLARKPLAVMVAAASLLVWWDFGTAGVGILWSVVLIVAMARRNPQDRGWP